MPFNNPVVGGTKLVRSAINSPNFSQVGETGWAVDQNGDAFFFNLQASGEIVGGNISGADITGSTIQGSAIQGSSVEASVIVVESAAGGLFVYALV